jgi:hypothetical protein
MIKTFVTLSAVTAANAFSFSSLTNFFSTSSSSSSSSSSFFGGDSRIDGGSDSFPSSAAELERYDARHSEMKRENNPHHHHHHRGGSGGWHRRFEAVRQALSPAEVILESGSEQGGKALLLSSSSSSSSMIITYSCVGSVLSTDVVVVTSWPSIEGAKPVLLKCIDETTGALVSNKNIDLSSFLLGGGSEKLEQPAMTLHGMLFSEVKSVSTPQNGVIDTNKRFYSLSASARVSIGTKTVNSKDEKKVDEDQDLQDDRDHFHHHHRHHQRGKQDREGNDRHDHDESISPRSLQTSTTTTTNTTGKERYTNPNCGQEGYPPCETLEEEQQDAVFQLMEGRVALIIATVGTIAIAYASQKYARED